MFGALSLLLVLAAAHSSSAGKIPYGILDGVIEKVINDLKPQLVGLVLPDINAVINETAAMGTLQTTNITTDKLDNFTIVNLKTTLLPIRLDELILNWEVVSLEGLYNLSALLDIDALQGPVQVDGSGNVEAAVQNLTLTVGATFNTVAGHLQIKEITKLLISLGESKVKLENILGGGSMEEVINVFLGFFLTEFINDSGDEVLKALEPAIIEKLNEILANIDFP